MNGSEKTNTLVLEGEQKTQVTWNGEVKLRRGNYLVIYESHSGNIREGLWLYTGSFWFSRTLQAPVEPLHDKIIAIAPFPKYER